ncbi:DUF6786 family protein [Seonamhaeicola maritimus]|uniref:Lipoprotein n=1 Tax=Seonamhaeicola maritimus TaxID=2591822 RepID=A0A5C7GDV3_9FLAO|nr:DUF6786 family protein [Seonamhaeicola maritimus]TXG34748.1 hypothetical protein FUA22_17725 [Seonamhaeicola maritimus]
MKHLFYILFFFLFIISCSSSTKKNYNYYYNLVKDQHEIVELVSNGGNSRILISPFHQGRILTSTYNNVEGISNGWINEEGLTDLNKSIGGEERLWIGPLGSQFSFYFQQIEPIHDDNWKVPSTMESEPYTLIYKDENHVELSKSMNLTNFVGTEFNLEVHRKISILRQEIIQKNLNIKLKNSTKHVAFETNHKLTNLDTTAWVKEKGLLGLWSAGMYPGDDSVVIIPLKNDGKKPDILTYLATIDSTRFIVKKNTVLFKVDGKYRSKIGIPPEFAPNIYGCYSKSKNKLTIVEYKKENDLWYSNSFVSIQEEPFQGEAIPIYNNSENFYELESNAPLKILSHGETTSHWHRVYHFSDSSEKLNKISQSLLHIDLNDIKLNAN